MERSRNTKNGNSTIRNGITPIAHVAGWRQRRNAHHHANPTAVTTAPQRNAHGRLSVDRARLSPCNVVGFALPALAPVRGLGFSGFALLFATSLAFVTMRSAAEYFGLQLVSV